MTLEEAITQACVSVGIVPPRGHIAMRKWVKADTHAKNGKGDGRIICDDDRVTCVNWQTGDKATVWLKEERTVEDKRRYAQQRADDWQAERARADRAAGTATRIIAAAQPGPHPYLARKGFASEQPLVVADEVVARIGGDYLVPACGGAAIVVPARIGLRVTSVQLIWTDGTKKFLYGGDMGGATHRVASGLDTWLCEGFATALSLRAALKGLSRRDTILVCFSASNIARVGESIRGRRWIAADHDAPPKAKPEQFNGLGAGEFYARKAGAPYLMPPVAGMDINDMHQADGIFVVQKLISTMIREAKM
jgi:putative DNA primase/helicase